MILSTSHKAKGNLEREYYIVAKQPEKMILRNGKTVTKLFRAGKNKVIIPMIANINDE